MPITALIADDEPLARADIRSRLSGQSDIEIVGEAVDVWIGRDIHLREPLLGVTHRRPPLAA